MHVNFGIHDCVAEKGYMYMWDETIAKRGSAEVASCLKHFFQVYPSGAKSLVSFSDGCGGQNKNLTLVGLYNELHLSGVYDILNHKFLTRGHTFLKNDSDFAQIEKRKASAEVFVPSDWFSVVREASRRSPFEVVAMQQEDFKNYKDFVGSRYTNRGNCEEELPKKPVGRLSVNCRPSVDRQVTDRLRKKENCGKHEQLT